MWPINNERVSLFTAIGFNVETVQYKNLKFQVWDLGGQTSIRPYWRCYYSNTDAIIYVVDSMDRDRIGISKQELVSMLEVPLLFHYRPRSRGDNTFGSVRVSVHLSVGALLFEPFDL